MTASVRFDACQATRHLSAHRAALKSAAYSAHPGRILYPCLVPDVRLRDRAALRSESLIDQDVHVVAGRIGVEVTDQLAGVASLQSSSTYPWCRKPSAPLTVDRPDRVRFDRRSMEDFVAAKAWLSRMRSGQG